MEGWCTGHNGVIIHTNDGGMSWDIQESGTEEWLKSIYFLNSQTGWAVGDRGMLLISNDGGKSWENEAITDVPFHSVYATGGHAWTVGEGGTILYRAMEIETGVTRPGFNYNNIPVEVFPNPFTGSFEIIFILEKPDYVSFQFYDMRGQLIEEIPSELFQEGRNRKVVRPARLLHGIILLRINSGDRKSVIKIIKN